MPNFNIPERFPHLNILESFCNVPNSLKHSRALPEHPDPHLHLNNPDLNAPDQYQLSRGQTDVTAEMETGSAAGSP